MTDRLADLDALATAERHSKQRIGPMCECGHGMFEHYMCGSADRMWCYYGKECGCKQFSDPTFHTRRVPK